MTRKTLSPEASGDASSPVRGADGRELSTVLATKRLLSGQILRAMKKNKVSQTELARRMRTSRAVIHRLLDENDSSVTLATISKAAAALGRGVRLKLSA